ncbi:MAG: (d)CMP kinase [Candidatus Bathyarchaeia archaeon]|nr:AAA family ATPase [Candidatus Bathyarchaeota archaeon A05DMB-4]MDH7595628.1 cytidylate kinase family protein [Candidatus Bathyarchaeota archaeon]
MVLKQPKKTPKNLAICVCGLTASGKSTVARKVAEKYNLRLYSGGDALKTLAQEAGYTPTERGWWESKEGLKFLSRRLDDPEFDKKVDTKLLEVAKEGNVVLDSWTMPWLLNGGFKVWIDASKKTRIKRLAKRDNINIKKASQVLEEKEEKTKTIYKRLYGFHLGEDFSPFDLILDTDKLNADEVFQAVSLVIDHVLLRKPQTNQ